ncbi:restriction endonuclease subunit S [Streptococcus dysgalactiae subsp. equisimilis]|uniref:restriction endonuclease subunit S n=1 Tax=Streptococcus dysgalactiae TaxID=1334 RepID=UPI00080703AF|nr:restriction endonuclease subunit S [Streptococcus dysgalactiae]OBY98045.1 restriction endonuclease subunit S [Streptococcus dysgalactiae subsp. equisimilis]OCX06566.1 restriction endonuclease subunit S [Streptococcus dysgalactiae subsp. equisimilis]
MNKIEKLIKKLCPNGVEWKSLGESCEIANSGRKPVKSSLRESGDIPYYGANNIQDYVNGYTHDGDYILIAEDGSASLENYSVQRVKGKFWANNHVHVIRGKDVVINGFLFHYFKYMNFSTYLTGGTRAKLTKSKLIEIKIPIPPLEIQEEIVKILDKFTEYVTELTTELTLRQKQYNYYRDKLLSFEETSFEIKKKRIGDILIKGKGTKITASQMKTLHKEGNPIRIFAGGKTFADIDYGDIPEKDVHEETAIIVKSRGIIDFEYYSKPFSFKNEFWSYSSIDENINLRYIYHYLKYNKNHFQNIANNMQMPQISSSDTENYLIPIPSIEIQSRIVQVLDNFDTVCNDLNIGLPKEIELRQKQYEFFRDKLLNFAAEGMYTDSTVQYSTDKT